MNADDVINSYVNDVARRLPHAKRNDVAFELRALLTDDLRARAQAEGRSPDRDMAVEMLRELGRPSETAVRYSQPFTIIAPSDTWGFLVAAVVGGIFVPSPAWLGVLVIVFGAKNLILRYRPDAFPWKPRRVPDRDPDVAGRVGNVAFALLLSGLLVLYLSPGPVVEALSGGRVAADTLAYSDSFANPWRMPWLAGILVAAIGLHLLVAVQGRWRGITRVAHITLVVNMGVQLGWHARYGMIFADRRVDGLLIPWINVASAVFAIVWLVALYRWWTHVSPAPAAENLQAA